LGRGLLIADPLAHILDVEDPGIALGEDLIGFRQSLLDVSDDQPADVVVPDRLVPVGLGGRVAVLDDPLDEVVRVTTVGLSATIWPISFIWAVVRLSDLTAFPGTSRDE
jgi:hypothetical protein